MTHEEEFENFVGGDDEVPPEELCGRCNNYPCECTFADMVEADG